VVDHSDIAPRGPRFDRWLYGNGAICFGRCIRLHSSVLTPAHHALNPFPRSTPARATPLRG
jgi:hypothetical protein